MDEYCNSRRNAIVKLFIDALTKGGPNGQSPRPIELNSHDPIRYMGDMLAWIHQATASENEFLRSLFRKFKENTGKKYIESKLEVKIAKKSLIIIELDATIKQSLGTIIDGVCRALRVIFFY